MSATTFTFVVLPSYVLAFAVVGALFVLLDCVVHYSNKRRLNKCSRKNRK